MCFPVGLFHMLVLAIEIPQVPHRLTDRYLSADAAIYYYGGWDFLRMSPALATFVHFAPSENSIFHRQIFCIPILLGFAEYLSLGTDSYFVCRGRVRVHLPAWYIQNLLVDDVG